MNENAASQDIIKSLFTPNVTASSTNLLSMVFTLLISVLAGFYIYYIYKRTFNGVLYSRTFNFSLVLLTLVITLVIRTISFYPILSLGMVGAVSIVRFRSAVKESADTVYMYWAVGTGIIFGAGPDYLMRGLVATAVIGLALYGLSLVKDTGIFPFLLIIRHDANCTKEVTYALRKLPRGARLKSKTVTQNGVEIIMELRLPDENKMLTNDLLKINGVYDSSLVRLHEDYTK